MKTVAPIDQQEVRRLEEICYRVRKGILTLVYNIGMGHLGGEMSMVETAVALYYRYMDFDVLDPHKPDRDRLQQTFSFHIKPSTLNPQPTTLN